MFTGGYHPELIAGRSVSVLFQWILDPDKEERRVNIHRFDLESVCSPSERCEGQGLASPHEAPGRAATRAGFSFHFELDDLVDEGIPLVRDKRDS